MHKNWAAINRVRDPHLRIALALSQRGTAEDTLLRSGLPVFFDAEIYQDGPVPLSALRVFADLEARRSGLRDADGRLIYYSALSELGLDGHVVAYTTNGTKVSFTPPFVLRMPSELTIPQTSQVGEVFSYGGQEYVLVENSAGDLFYLILNTFVNSQT